MRGIAVPSRDQTTISVFLCIRECFLIIAVEKPGRQKCRADFAFCGKICYNTLICLEEKHRK